MTADIPESSYVNALLCEAKFYARGGIFIDKEIDTIYIGGGTPTLFSPSGLSSIIQGINSIWPISNRAEISVEANPETLSLEYINGLRQTEITRISIGMQTFSDRLLSYLGRVHTSERSIHAFYDLRNKGFNNINIDLIYGIPTQGIGELEFDLDRIFRLNPEHISAYLLQHESGTWFATIPPCPERDIERFFNKVAGYLSGLGFEQYEISNFARPTYACRHNLAYWAYQPYLGLGASAVSCIKEGERWENISDPYAYMDRIKKAGSAVVHTDIFGEDDIFFEKKFLSLRTRNGIDIKDIPQNIPDELFTIRNGKAVLTPKGMLLSDEIFSML